ncbi:MAG: hypothetical protein JXR25_00755 [Pontiellaceae bacterium]|nr:hypothetical protein [Pontiellaceae bacterium]MBN2783328.1 hypothetical protein [Pontiellaceae bacterium]
MRHELKPEWKTEQTICSYDVDPQATVRLAALCRFMQEAAYHHAEHLGLGRQFLLERRMAWVLARQRIDVIRLPQWGDRVNIRTWPSGRDRLFFYRDFELTDGAGQRVLTASNAWSLIDLEKRQRVHPEIYMALDIPEGSPVFDARPARLKGDAGEPVADVTVTYGDLDLNGHVNNVRYLEWIIDHLPRTFQENHALLSMESNFLAEALDGQAIRICTVKCGAGGMNHCIRSGGTELFRARTRWMENGETHESSC